MVTLPQNSYNLFRSIRSYIEKENLIGSAVSKILWYRHTHKQRHPITFLDVIQEDFMIKPNKSSNTYTLRNISAVGTNYLYFYK